MARPKRSGHSTGFKPSANDVAALQPFRDTTIRARLIVPCKIHNAELGEPCRSATGKVVSCQVRRKLAIRKLNEDKEKEAGL